MRNCVAFVSWTALLFQCVCFLAGCGGAASPPAAKLPPPTSSAIAPAKAVNEAPALAAKAALDPKKEDTEVLAHFKKKKWVLGLDRRVFDQKQQVFLNGNTQDLKPVTLSAEDWKMIGKSKTLQFFNLDMEITNWNDGYKALEGLPHLTGILLKGNGVDDVGLKQLAKLQTLEVVMIMFSKKISAGGLKDVSQLPKLKSLTLLHTSGVTGSLFTDLAAATQLEELDVETFEEVGKFQEAQVKKLGELKSLKSIRLRKIPVGDAIFEVLPSLPKLERLSLGSCGETEAAVEKAKKDFPKLKF